MTESRSRQDEDSFKGTYSRNFFVKDQSIPLSFAAPAQTRKTTILWFPPEAAPSSRVLIVIWTSSSLSFVFNLPF